MLGHCIDILADLWEQDGVIQQDLAISIVKDKATIARALELMEKIIEELSKLHNVKILLLHFSIRPDLKRSKIPGLIIESSILHLSNIKPMLINRQQSLTI